VVLSSNAPRLNNVNFALRVGAVVPVSVHAIAVTPALIAIRPEFRDHFFFVVRDEIVILDSGHRVTAIIPVGDDVGSNEGPPNARVGVGVAQDFSNLSAEEIRLVQQALVAQGFAIEVDGVFGPGTRQALISFQQRHGFAATGRIDSRTIVALNVNIRGSGGAATTGQGSPSAQQPAANPNMNQQGQSGSQPATPQAGSSSTTPQSGSSSTTSQSGSSSTTGQGSASPPQSSGATSGQAPANNPPSASTPGSGAAPSAGSMPSQPSTPNSPGSSQGGQK
jgi:peptidoglycan hydrolase-like protein with peptidoglycan-binding domain